MIRRYLELRRLGLGWYHWVGELLAKAPPRLYMAICDIIGTAEWLWRRKRASRVSQELQELLRLAGTVSVRPSSRRHFCYFWRLKLAHAYIALAPMDYVERLMTVEGGEHLETLLTSGRGFVLASLHSLHGHLGAAYLVRRGKPTQSFRKAQRAEFLETSAERLIFYGATPVFLEQDVPMGAVLKRSFDWLRRGNAAFVFVDGVYGQQEVAVEVFGRPVRLRPGLLEAARLSQSPVMPVTVLVRGDRISLRFAHPGNIATREELEQVLRNIAKEYETAVELSPESLPLGKFERRLIERSK